MRPLVHSVRTLAAAQSMVARRPLGALRLLVAVLLVAAGTLALTHAHLDASAESDCAVCTLAKYQALAADAAAAPQPTVLPHAAEAPSTPTAPVADLRTSFEARAPPR